jgi:hypothetical protein
MENNWGTICALVAVTQYCTETGPVEVLNGEPVPEAIMRFCPVLSPVVRFFSAYWQPLYRLLEGASVEQLTAIA